MEWTTFIIMTTLLSITGFIGGSYAFRFMERANEKREIAAAVKERERAIANFEASREEYEMRCKESEAEYERLLGDLGLSQKYVEESMGMCRIKELKKGEVCYLLRPFVPGAEHDHIVEKLRIVGIDDNIGYWCENLKTHTIRFLPADYHVTVRWEDMELRYVQNY